MVFGDHPLIRGAGILLGVFFLLWVVSLWRKKASIVDVFWSLGFLMLALFYWMSSGGGLTAKTTAVLTAVSLWSVRLAAYLAWRNWGKPEDHRYAAMRKLWGGRFWWVSLFTVFLLQATLLWLIAMPLYAVFSRGEPSWTCLDTIAALLFLVGLSFETVADWQLARFKSQPENAGKVLRSGLWRYSRHPNYFGEALVWWSLYLFAFTSGAWWSVFSPLLMTYLLLRVSGVPLLESALRQRNPEYEAYIRTTSAFLPWPPKQEPSGPLPIHDA
ncbi:MAG: DUF1295 domain-containing protein [Candidatus Binatia bacterium]|nr:DUF1295 domain-containing protein [Candidatus Binatia bacterium]